MTPFGKALYHIYQMSGCVSIAEFCQHMGVSNGSVRHWMNSEEPAWLRNLRTIKRRTGLTWGEILDGHAEACGECPECGAVIDRDVNAATNILNVGMANYPELMPVEDADATAERPAKQESSGKRRFA